MRLMLLSTLSTALLVALIFACAGRLDLPFLWAYLGVSASGSLAAGWLMDPDLKKERLRPGPGGTDRPLRFVVMPFWLGHLVIAAFDVGRFHWSDHVPLALQVVGLIALAAMYVLLVCAIRVNRFFSPVVRIQSERGHVVVSDGPYGWVRHPGYAALVIGMPLGGLALGSWWSLAPVLALLILVLRRTIIEDRFLERDLEGYADYARRVPYRLIPGIW